MRNFSPFWAFYLIQSETFHSTNPLHKKPTTENNLLKRFFKIRGEQIITRTKQFKSLPDFRVLLLLPKLSRLCLICTRGGGDVICHNFCCGATILVWKVALESLYKQLSNEIKIGTTGTEDIRQTKKCSFQL